MTMKRVLLYVLALLVAGLFVLWIPISWPAFQQAARPFAAAIDSAQQASQAQANVAATQIVQQAASAKVAAAGALPPLQTPSARISVVEGEPKTLNEVAEQAKTMKVSEEQLFKVGESDENLYVTMGKLRTMLNPESLTRFQYTVKFIKFQGPDVIVSVLRNW